MVKLLENSETGEVSNIRIHDKTNEKVNEQLLEFPTYTIKCKLEEIMDDRGMSFQDLHDLTGIRLASISELAKMKRSSLNVTQLLVIAKTLRLVDIADLFEISMSDDTYDQFIKDRNMISFHGVTEEQADYLSQKRKARKKLKGNKKPTDQ